MLTIYARTRTRAYTRTAAAMETNQNKDCHASVRPSCSSSPANIFCRLMPLDSMNNMNNVHPAHCPTSSIAYLCMCVCIAIWWCVYIKLSLTNRIVDWPWSTKWPTKLTKAMMAMRQRRMRNCSSSDDRCVRGGTVSLKKRATTVKNRKDEKGGRGTEYVGISYVTEKSWWQFCVKIGGGKYEE